MAISIDWGTKVISVPLSYLVDLGGNVYELDVDQFRLDLKDLEDSEEGMPFPDTHRHATEVTLSGVTYARSFEIINGYTVTFENGNYTVWCVGANHNIGDVKNVNSVSLIIGNSAGLISVVSGSGVTEQDKLDIADQVWDEDREDHKAVGSFGEAVVFLRNVEGGKWEIVETPAPQMVFYTPDGMTEIARFNLYDKDGNPSAVDVFKRELVT